MTSVRDDDRTAAAAAPRLVALRANCTSAGVLLITEFALGAGVNLYVVLPGHGSFLPTVFSSAALAAHAIVGVLLLAAAIGALVRALRVRRGVVFTSTGLAAVLAAWIAGAVFVSDQGKGASLSMALATAVAMLCYLAAVFSLRAPA